MSKLTLVFSDGDVGHADVRPEETLLAAARRNGIALASDCEVGDCQTCRARMISGAVEYNGDMTISLSADEVAAGEVLTCVATTSADVKVQLPYQRGQLLTAKPFTMIVQSVTRLCESVVRLSARTTRRAPIAFLPGQYVNLKVPGTDQWRSYSMANAPSSNGFEFGFFVRLLDDGAMSRYLLDRAAAGDMIEAKGPFGAFYLRDTGKPALMIAGGTGLAPMLAMLRAMIAAKSTGSVTLCFGVTRPQDLFCVDELNALRQSLGSYDLRIAVMQDGAELHTSGVVTDLVRAEDVPGRNIYLCGPPAMTDRARAVLATLGADPASVFVERFVPFAGAAAGPSAANASQLAGADL